MKIKRVIALFLMLSLVLGTVACSKEKQEDSSQNAQSNVSEEKSNTNDETNNTNDEESNEDGKITLSWYGINPPYEDGTWGEETFESLFNVDVKIVRAESEDEFSTLLASGEIPDVFLVESLQDVGKYQKLGILASVTEDEIKEHMPNYYDMCVEKDPNIFRYSVIDGVNYGVSKMEVTGGVARAAAIRADWLKACGIDKVPTTLEELEVAFDAFVNQDPDGNGVKDTYALSSATDYGKGKRFFSSIFGAYGINPLAWTEKDGELEYGFATEECKEALKLLHSWYEKGYIDPEFVTNEGRSSGTDVPYKFANGKIGFVDGYSFEDYQWDNDGHINAKWTATSSEWQAYYEENAEDLKKLYAYDNVTDFSDDMIDPYYIILEKVVGPAGDKSGYFTNSAVSGYICFGIQLEEERDKMYKAMEIFEQQATDPDIAINHYGPEGYQWEWNEDKTERLYIANFSDKPDYNAQGQIIGNGLCLWPMYKSNTKFLSLVGGARMEQRYDRDMQMFSSLPVIRDAVTVSLSVASEKPDLVKDYPIEYLVKAIRGDIDIEKDWDGIVETWYKNGGTDLTNEANEWYASTK